MGVAKVNWDAILNIRKQKMGIEIIVKDCDGEVLAYLCTLRVFNSQPILVECMTLWCAIKFNEDLGLPFAQLDGDTHTIIQTKRRVMPSMRESWKISKKCYSCTLIGPFVLYLKKETKWDIV